MKALFVRLGQICIATWAATVLIPAAYADSVTFTLNASTATGNSCASCGPFGTVTVTSDGTNEVTVKETLASGIEYVRTKAGDALSFNVSDDPSITIGSLTTGFTQGTGDTKGDTGDFDYGIGCSGCGHGGSSPEPGPLTFTVSVTSGTLTPSDFEVASGKGFYVASDVIDDNASGKRTGNAEATDPTTPEPSTMLLFGTGLLAIASTIRRRSTVKSI